MVPRRATCHPERARAAFGLCSQCYRADYRKRHAATARAQQRHYWARHKAEINAKRRAWRRVHKVEHEAEQQYRRQNGKLKARYRLNAVQVRRIIKEQGNACLICRGRKRLIVEHDHVSGGVRGIVCDRCNQGLGKFRDDPGLCERAALYLRTARTVEMAREWQEV